MKRPVDMGVEAVFGRTSVAEGDRARHERLAALYRAHIPSAVRLAFLLTGDPLLGEDLAQEAFVRVIGRLGHLRDEQAFEAYLRRSVVNLCLSYFRRQRVERTTMERLHSWPLAGSIEYDVAGEEALRQAVFALPPQQRAAIVLRFYEDLPESRVAEILRCRTGTVRSRVTRGMQTLRARLAWE